eukprot:5590278-Lingulodinium_polyedra.AAC.1
MPRVTRVNGWASSSTLRHTLLIRPSCASCRSSMASRRVSKRARRSAAMASGSEGGGRKGAAEAGGGAPGRACLGARR